jgi:HTH-type transcriptional regulator/antitoxin HipB
MSSSRPIPSHNPKNAPDRENVIGLFVRQHRKAAGLTQRELAELASVGPRAIWDLERGKATLRMDVADRVLRVFGKTLGIVDATREESGP